MGVRRIAGRQKIMNINLDSKWNNLSGEVNGKRAYIRVNAGLRPLAGAERYAQELIISVRLQQPKDNGLPSDEELVILDNFEDALRPLLQEQMESLLAVVMTTDGFRDFIFYTSDMNSAVRRFQVLQPSFGNLQIDVSSKPDKQWTQYERFS